ncbi:MAG TPA: IS630 family transposase, partial [Ktedonobacterales bacterium]|nr:IS630 family transposase [Ktedonobacterales bacterium]
MEAAIAAVRQAHPDDALEVWAEDEHRVGLKPIVRWVWARRGQRVLARVQHRYVWDYLYAFVRPTTGTTWWLLLPSVRTELFALALASFAQATGAGDGKQVLLLIDGA